ncbi:zinc finger HIT domain-containing protein 1 [Onthophagus taurus]|uniref:zinc finger HIT domain-containing protein 1 n=1 Tax=Onthophagus taurus TaxID=166361 RepID=UPI000C2054D4|nr:zinc finger HIT domain-containing protein 1 [Onthophagus taurus]
MSAKPVLRGSQRYKEGEKRRIVDETSRKRRHKKFLESLEMDNFHDDPHADLVMSKKLPKFEDNLESRTRSKKKERNPEYYPLKYRKTFQQLIEDDRKEAEETGRISFGSITVEDSQFPPLSFCAVCGFYGNYICVACGTKLCSNKCLDTHYETRCLKWTV